jgi:hypothetical protein
LDWQLSHPAEARAGIQDCGACHRSQASCRDCHNASGVSEGSTSRPRNVRFHPVGYGDGRHAAEAQLNLKACTSCHGEKDCIRCHGATGFGAGHSPHPPGFQGRCALLRQRNERPCLKCHSAQDLQGKCP